MSASIRLEGLDTQRIRDALQESGYWNELDRTDVMVRPLEGNAYSF